MAISKNDRKKYLDDWHEVLDHVSYGYVDKTILILAEQGLQVSKSKIYNVVSGSIKDRSILDAIRKVVLPIYANEHDAEMAEISNKKLNLFA